MTLTIRQFIIMPLLVAFTASMIQMPQAYAQTPFMPKPGVRVGLSVPFNASSLTGMVIHPENALRFDFLVNPNDDRITQAQKQEEYMKLVKYFMASLTVADRDQWVNLSPYEKNRIVDENFGNTAMGRDLLAQDYLLKQITSSLMYPEDKLGKEFWGKVYEKAKNEYGVTQIPVNTFNKVWIVPEKAEIFEKGNTVVILNSRLKVMLEEDYLAMQKNSITTDQRQNKNPINTTVKNPLNTTDKNFLNTSVETQHLASKHNDTTNTTNTPTQPLTTKNLSLITKKIIREIILPELQKEVNEGKNFAPLRQMYSAMILSTWFKRALKESLLGKVYSDKNKLFGVKTDDPKANEAIYQQYLKAYKKGAFNYIKEEIDTNSGKQIPRKYFSGGILKTLAMTTVPVNPSTTNAAMNAANRADMVAVSFDPKRDSKLVARENRAMSVKQIMAILLAAVSLSSADLRGADASADVKNQHAFNPAWVYRVPSSWYIYAYNSDSGRWMKSSTAGDIYKWKPLKEGGVPPAGARATTTNYYFPHVGMVNQDPKSYLIDLIRVHPSTRLAGEPFMRMPSVKNFLATVLNNLTDNVKSNYPMIKSVAAAPGVHSVLMTMSEARNEHIQTAQLFLDLIRGGVFKEYPKDVGKIIEEAVNDYITTGKSIGNNDIYYGITMFIMKYWRENEHNQGRLTSNEEIHPTIYPNKQAKAVEKLVYRRLENGESIVEIMKSLGLLNDEVVGRPKGAAVNKAMTSREALEKATDSRSRLDLGHRGLGLGNSAMLTKRQKIKGLALSTVLALLYLFKGDIIKFRVAHADLREFNPAFALRFGDKNTLDAILEAYYRNIERPIIYYVLPFDNRPLIPEFEDTFEGHFLDSIRDVSFDEAGAKKIANFLRFILEKGDFRSGADTGPIVSPGGRAYAKSKLLLSALENRSMWRYLIEQNRDPDLMAKFYNDLDNMQALVALLTRTPRSIPGFILPYFFERTSNRNIIQFGLKMSEPSYSAAVLDPRRVVEAIRKGLTNNPRTLQIFPKAEGTLIKGEKPSQGVENKAMRSFSNVLNPNNSIQPAKQGLTNDPGGIDFNSANLDMYIKRDGRGVPLPVAKQDWAMLQQIPGFVPVILEIKPAVHSPVLADLQV